MRHLRPARALILAVALGSIAGAADWPSKAPPLPPPEGKVIDVPDDMGLQDAVSHAESGATIRIAEGIYPLDLALHPLADGVTLRGASGDRTKVILDGSKGLGRGSEGPGNGIEISFVSNVTIADLTLQNFRGNGVWVTPHLGAHRVTVRNCVFRNIWQRGIKGPFPKVRVATPKGCRIEYCLFTNDRPKRYEDDPADRPETYGGNSIGGIDVMGADGWTISDNVFVGLRGRTGRGRGAILLSNASRDCVIERNIIVDCDAGIGLGTSSRFPEYPVHCFSCIVRNNFVTRTPEAGILAEYTWDCRILHNTVHDPEGRPRGLIRVVHDNNGLVVANNLLDGDGVLVETPGEIELANNVAGEFSDALAGPATGDLHLKRVVEELRGRADPRHGVPDDIDGQPRKPRTDVGADERRP
jgi:hypothetical protein